MDFFERFVVLNGVFKNPGRDDDIERLIRIRKLDEIRKLSVLQIRGAVKDFVPVLVEEIAAVKFDIPSERYTSQTGIRSMTAAPVEDGTRILKMLEIPRKNTDLMCDESRRCVIGQVRIGIALLLLPIQIAQP